MNAYGWALRVVWVVLAIWLACAIGEQSGDKQFQTAVLVLVIELLVLGIVEMLCYQIRLMRL